MEQNNDNFFTPAANTKPFFKAAFEGFAGTGKTYTVAQIAIGIHKRIGSKKPVVIFDTEKAAKFLKDLFASEGIELLVREAKSLADLEETMNRCKAGASDVLIIDSISHVWEKFLQDYQQSKNRTRLEFADWGVVKPMWKRMFTDRFVGDSYHTLMTGRAGYEYDNEKNAETGKREIFKTGIKMKVEGETAYEPDMLVLMERFEEILTDKKRVFRQATVIKDRSTLLDGKTFENPDYENFAPAIEALLRDPAENTASPERPIEFQFRSEEEKYEFRRERDKWVEEIDGLLNRVFPSSTGKDRANKLEILTLALGTTSETAIKDMRPDALRRGYEEVIRNLVDLNFAYYVDKDGQKFLRVGQPEIAIPPAAEVVPPVHEKPAADVPVRSGKVPARRAVGRTGG